MLGARRLIAALVKLGMQLQNRRFAAVLLICDVEAFGLTFHPFFVVSS